MCAQGVGNRLTRGHIISQRLQHPEFVVLARAFGHQVQGLEKRQPSAKHDGNLPGDSSEGFG